MEILNAVRENLSRLLKEGQLNPYDDEIKNNETLSVEEAFKFALSQKAKTLAETSFGNYKNRIKNFEKYLLQNGFKNRFITSVTKKDVNKYLNDVLQKTSASNRNNSRTDISSLFTTLSNEDIIPVNFIHKIPVLKSNPEKNTAFNQEEVKAIFEKAKKEDVWLYYFISHIYYGLFRNVEIVRIQIADINIKEKKIKSNTKTGNFYKQIPQILIDEFYTNLDLSKYPKDYFLFTKDNEPSQWLTRPNKETGKRSITEEINRRGYWGKRFNKIIKEPMGFAKDYTSYSFRHSAIGKMFIEKVKELRKEGTPDFEDKALDFIRKITAHKDNDTVRNYLREIGYYKIDDWSNLLK
ncbi:tyrosine-type recombinase/integrase [Tenacibaculum sp. nBUS_03]|uniref:tyrosine-type recombinase/integrase n=1 Tax=Tenacibaculum sp. nBUS_03 TaxID=3395320 RepID=UPI003EBDD805